jgi:hypothetical protein
MPESGGDFAECYAFSIHKAGSTLMHRMIAEVCQVAGIPGLSIPDALFREGVLANDWEKDQRILELIGPGRIYFGFRHLPPVLLDDRVGLRGKKCALLVRDPRDALVSQYYSFGGKHVSHRPPARNAEVFLEKVRSTETWGIDKYVLRSARSHLKKLVSYKDNLNFSNVLLRRYEDVYFDKRTFLADIFQHFGIAVSPETLDEVARSNDVRPTDEDPSRHIRRGLPGDHVNKLKPATIRKLNDIFSDTCSWYGYDLK